MAVQYPSYDADPNGVPKYDGFNSAITGFQKGYALANAPQQMRLQIAQQRANLENQQNINKYYGPKALQDIALSKAQAAQDNAAAGYTNKQTSRYDDITNSDILRNQVLNANTRANTSLTDTQANAAADDLANQRAFYAAIRAAQAAQGQPDTAQAQPSGNAQAAPAAQGNQGYGGQPSQVPAAQSADGQSSLSPYIRAPQQNGYAGAQQQQNPYAASQQQMAPQQMPQQGNGQQAMPPQGAPQQPMASPQAGGANAPQENIIQTGDPSLAYLDKIAENPLYAKELNKMGIKPPSTDTKYQDGMMVSTTTYPSGKVTSQAVPVAAAQTAKNTGPGEQAAYTAIQKQYRDSVEMQQQLQQLATVINKPGFDNATGPLKKWLPKMGMSDKDVSEVYGQLQTGSNTLQAKMASTFSSRVTNMGLGLAARTKPNDNDTAPVIRGKMEALNAGNRWVMDYSKAYQRNMLNNMNSLDASQAAEAQVPADKYAGQMKTYLDEGEAANKIMSYNDKLSKQNQIEIIYKPDKFGDALPYVRGTDQNGRPGLMLASKYVRAAGLG